LHVDDHSNLDGKKKKFGTALAYLIQPFEQCGGVSGRKLLIPARE
jgi:hypothetical protein